MLTGKRKELLSISDYFRRSLYRKVCQAGKRLAFVKQTLFTRGVFYTTGDNENIKNRTILLFLRPVTDFADKKGAHLRSAEKFCLFKRRLTAKMRLL